MRLYRIVIYFLLGGLILSPSFSFAQTSITPAQEIEELNKQITAHREQMKQLEETMNTYKKNIMSRQNQAVSLKNQLGILNDSLSQIRTDIQYTGQSIYATELEIKSLGLSIAEKEAIMAKEKKLISSLVQNILARDRATYVEIFLSHDSFADFFNDLKNIESVYADLGRSVKSLRAAAAELKTNKQNREKKRESLENLKSQLENKKSALNEQSDYKQKLLTDTKASEQRYQTLLTSLRRQYQIIEAEERSFEAQVRKKLEEQDKIQKAGTVLMSWPTPSRFINATFHDSTYPFRNIFQHNGIDIRAAKGTVIRASAPGYIARAKRCSLASCYSYVMIIHTGSLSTVYGHLSAIAVNDDQFVNRGDVIGYSGGIPGQAGSGPFVTGPHLHYEVRLNGIPVNPEPYLVQ